MLFSGSNQGVNGNENPNNLPFKTPNLGAQLFSKNLTFAGYSEGLPQIGFTGESVGNYARKHSPWVLWQGEGENTLSPETNQPFSNFPKDFSKLPTVSFVTPNLDNDMHDGFIDSIKMKRADEWIKKNLSNYINWAETNNSLFILTFDEDDYFHNNKITTIFNGPMVKSGLFTGIINHYSILRTLQDMYQLPYAGESANSQPISDCWK